MYFSSKDSILLLSNPTEKLFFTEKYIELVTLEGALNVMFDPKEIMFELCYITLQDEEESIIPYSLIIRNSSVVVHIQLNWNNVIAISLKSFTVGSKVFDTKNNLVNITYTLSLNAFFFLLRYYYTLYQKKFQTMPAHTIDSNVFKLASSQSNSYKHPLLIYRLWAFKDMSNVLCGEKRFLPWDLPVLGGMSSTS
jgi:hypothetical protein